jgi:hypothetical protein
VFRVYINSISGTRPARLDFYDMPCETHARTLFQKACTQSVALDVLLQERMTYAGCTYWATIKQWHSTEG